MRKIPLFIPFVLALFATVMGSALIPFVRLSTFSPFLGIVYHVSSFSKSIWIALGCGLILDLLSSELKFGLYGLNFVFITLLLYSQKKHFFEDKPLGLALFTALISSVSTIVQLLLAHLFDRGIPFSSGIVGIDAVLLSFVDGIYAFLWFTCPMRLYTYIKKVGWRRVFKPRTNE